METLIRAVWRFTQASHAGKEPEFNDIDIETGRSLQCSVIICSIEAWSTFVATQFAISFSRPIAALFADCSGPQPTRKNTKQPSVEIPTSHCDSDILCSSATVSLLLTDFSLQ